MSKHAFVIKFWWDGENDSTRLRNVNFTWPAMKKLQQTASERGVDCEAFVYDFSPEKKLDDAIHIPYPLSVYKRAEKINKIIHDLKSKQFDVLVLSDCDLFLHEQDHVKFIESIKQRQPGEVIFHDAAQLDSDTSNKIVDANGEFNPEEISYRFSYSGDKSNGPLKSVPGGFGGLYVCDLNTIIDGGGYDEGYVAWGGEDGNLLSRLIEKKILTWGQIKSTRDYFPYHLNHFRDHTNPLYYDKSQNKRTIQ